LQERGWRQGGNIELTYRWPGAELDAVRAAASEIAASRPELIVSRLAQIEQVRGASWRT